MNAEQLHDLHADARATRRRAQSALDHFRDGHLDIPARKRAQLLWLEQQLVAAVEQQIRMEIFHGQAKRKTEANEPLPQGD